MVLKYCKACDTQKPVSLFCRNRANKDGFGFYCKECSSSYRKARSKQTPVEVVSKKCSHCGLTKPASDFSKNRARKDWLSPFCKECSRKHYQENREVILDRCNKYRTNNPERRREVSRLSARRCRARNPEKERLAQQKADRKRREKIGWSVRKAVSVSVYLAIKHRKAGRSWEKILGYTLADLLQHLESAFEPWMGWHNHGVHNPDGPRTWQIDHIRPVSSFDFSTNPVSIARECWALENLRPLDSFTNISQGARTLSAAVSAANA